MPAYDGAVVIETRLSTDGVKKGVKELRKELNSLEKESTKTMKKIEAESRKMEMLQRKVVKDSKFDDQMRLKGIAPGSDDYIKEMNALLMSNDKYAAMQKNISSYEGEHVRLEKAIKATKEELQKASDESSKFEKSIKKLDSKMSGFGKSFKKLANMAKSLIIFRMIYSLMGLMMTGFQNLAQASSEFNSIMSGFQSNATYLSNALATSLAPVLQSLLPIFDSITEAVVKAVNAVGMFLSALTGSNRKFVQAKKVQQDYATSLGSSNKAQEKQLASFDTVQKLSNGQNAGGSSGSSAGSMFEEVEIPNEMIEKADRFKEIMQPTVDAFERLKKSLSGLGKTAFAGLEWAYLNIFIPFGTWAAQSFLPAFFDLLAQAVKLLDKTIQAMAPALEWLWDNLVSPAFATAGDMLVSVIDTIKQALEDLNAWADENPDIFQGLVVSIGVLVGAFLLANSPILEMLAMLMLLTDSLKGMGATTESLVVIFGALGVAILAMSSPILAVVAAIALVIYAFYNWEAVMEGLSNIASSVWEAIKNVWNGAGEWFNQTIVEPLKEMFNGLKDAVIEKFKEAWNGIKEAWQSAKDWFSSTFIDPVVKAFDDATKRALDFFKSLWDGITTIWKETKSWFATNVTDPLVNGFKDAINFMISFAEGFVNGFIRGINRLISALNNALSFSIPDWVPIVGGNSFSLNLPTASEITLPRLAKGDVAMPNNPYLALLGDNKSEEEVVSPLSTMKQALREALEENGMSKSITVVMELNGREFGRAVYQANNQETQRVGVKLAKGGSF